MIWVDGRRPFRGHMHARSFHEAVDQLSKVSAQAGPRAVLTAIGRCAPVAGGTIATMLISGPIQSLTSHAVHLPSDMFDSWMSTPPQDLAKMMAPMVRGPVGGLFTDRREITGRFREQLDVVRSVRAVGLGETAGYKVGARRTASGTREIMFMTLALDGGATFSAEHHEVLAALQPAIEAAVRRLRVPLLSSESILAQILEEQTVGYACVSDEGRIVEANGRAYALALRYAQAARVSAGRNTLKDLAARYREATEARSMRLLDAGSGRGLLEVNVHRLARETHPIPEDLMLLVMREVAASARSASLPLNGLTRRQQEVALLLATTGGSYKEIAARLTIRDGTMRTHVENIYRRLGVRSREELMVRWHSPVEH